MSNPFGPFGPMRRERTALLVMDYLSTIVQGYGGPNAEAAATNARIALESARKAGLMVVHVLPGAANIAEAAIAIHPAVKPLPDEAIVRKTRIGALSTTGLDTMLRAAGRDTLALMGVATSGVVLSTARHAFDLGYKLFIIEDACGEPDPDAHRALTRQDTFSSSWVGLWRLGTILSTEQFTKSLG